MAADALSVRIIARASSSYLASKSFRDHAAAMDDLVKNRVTDPNLRIQARAPTGTRIEMNGRRYVKYLRSVPSAHFVILRTLLWRRRRMTTNDRLTAILLRIEPPFNTAFNLGV